MRLVLLAALLGGLGIGFGCSHEARPVVAPDDHPPVPPASPIGYLVEDAAELKLRDDQLAQLRQIDDELGARLATYESELRNGEPVPQGDPPPSRGGMDARASAGGTEPHGPVGDVPLNSARTAPPVAQTKTYVLLGETVTRIHRDRARDTKAAIQRAFAVLDRAQQVISRRVLTEHGVNPDTGAVTEGGEPGARPADNPLAPIQQAEPEPSGEANPHH
ncbi:MAG TPA: hypothetical protein VHT91_31420 [Kofleriaceae bacterium]|jgi:hypothetical protein|nr:hypothetical protein [Kofleriaceae bacterium]